MQTVGQTCDSDIRKALREKFYHHVILLMTTNDWIFANKAANNGRKLHFYWENVLFGNIIH